MVQDRNHSPVALEGETREVVLRVRDVQVSFGPNHILRGLDLDVFRGEVLGFVGGSGTGKSVLTRAVLDLTPRQKGTIELFGHNYDELEGAAKLAVDRRIGVLFQHGALFSALTVKENVQVPMREYFELPQRLMDELAAVKLELVGLPVSALDKYPSELSGGMVKRAALARALALDPDLVDELIASLRDTLGLTVFMVTHDLDSLQAICDRIAVLRDGKVLVAGPLTAMFDVEDEWVASYFNGKRARLGALMPADAAPAQ